MTPELELIYDRIDAWHDSDFDGTIWDWLGWELTRVSEVHPAHFRLHPGSVAAP